MASVRANVSDPTGDLFRIEFPDGSFFRDRRDNNCSAWPKAAAMVIARNVAKKRKTTVGLVKIEEPVDVDSPFDRILNYVSQMDYKALRKEIVLHGLSLGSDSAYSKRERLISHLTKCRCN